MLKRKIEKTYLEINGKKVPVKVYREWRNSVRFSIGKNGANLRLPMLLGKSQQEEQIRRFDEWVRKQFSNRESLNKRFFGKGYQDGDTLNVGKRTYRIRINYTENKSHSAKLIGDEIHLKLTKLDSETNIQKAIKKLLSRTVAKDFMPEIRQRVFTLNKKYFQKDIRNVSLKYNTSNWGSCSSKNNINLSTRLLFAPDSVIDYVIIHELSHLLEMNHSPRFWAIVEKAMPNYRAQELWLKKNGHHCDF